ELGESAPRTFNASLPAGDPTVFERVFDDLLRQGCRPQWLVLEIAPGTLNQNDNWLHQHALNVLDWRDVVETVPALCRNGRIMYLVRGRLLPLFLHRYHICKQLLALAVSTIRPAPCGAPSDPPIPPPVTEDPKPPPSTPEHWARLKACESVAREVKNYRP